MNKFLFIATIFGTAAMLAGCVPSLVGTAATTGGAVVAQERSVGNAVDDQGIRLTIYNLYLRKDFNDLFKNVAIRVVEGRVMLTGDVNKPETAVEAVRLAWLANGVREVISEIQVNDQTGLVDYAKDGWIATQIRTKLLFEKNLRSVNYSVEVVNGVVYLMGIAQDQEELGKATYIASVTPNVKQVISHVLLKDDMRRKIYTQNATGGPDNTSSGSSNSSSTNNDSAGNATVETTPVNADEISDRNPESQHR